MRRVIEISTRFPVDRRRGFTLVEMIVSIVITGILLGMVMIFGRDQINAYLSVGNRAQLSDAADTALRRIARDLQGALPNSVRVTAAGDFLEFVPIHDAGRYRAQLDNAGSGNPLDFSNNADDSFDVLGPAVTVQAGDQLVILNLGQAGSDVYAGTSRRALKIAAGSASSLQFDLTTGGQFPFASPQSRFQLVGAPVTYECSVATGTLIRHSGYGFNSAQPTTFGTGALSSVLVDNVSSCAFSYSPGVLQQNGIVVLHLKLTRDNETVDLMHEVEIRNSP